MFNEDSVSTTERLSSTSMMQEFIYRIGCGDLFGLPHHSQEGQVGVLELTTSLMLSLSKVQALQGADQHDNGLGDGQALLGVEF